MKTGLSILLIGVALLLQACGSRPRIAKVTEASVVIAFGDSLTAGTGATEDESYPAVLAGILGCRVINAGVPGEQSAAGRERLQHLLRKQPADLVILCEGGNDMLHGLKDETIAEQIRAMVATAKRSGADVILLGVPRPRILMKVPDFYSQIADENGILCDTKTIRTILATPALKSDQIHPNAAGYRRLAENVSIMIREAQRD